MNNISISKIGRVMRPLKNLEVDHPYLDVIVKLTYAVYITLVSNEATHPIFKEFVNKVQQYAKAFANQTKVVDETDTILRLCSVIDKLAIADFHVSYIDIDAFERALHRHVEKLPTILPVSFYKPLLMTLCKRRYSGLATIPKIHLNEFGFDFNFNEVRNFDNEGKTQYSPLANYFESFDFYDTTFDDFITLCELAFLPGCNYNRQMTFGEICRQLRRNIGFRERAILGRRVECIDRFWLVNLLKSLTLHTNNLRLEESYYLPKIGYYLGLSDLCINYFMKKSQVTVEERDAFLDSCLNKYQKTDSTIGGIPTSEDSLSATSGLEALEDELDDTDLEDIPDAEGDDPTEDVDEASDEEDDSKDDDSEDDESDSEDEDTLEEEDTDTTSSDKIPTDEPAFISLELAGDDETLTDLLYKFQVCELVNKYREDPPTNLASEELLLLERWCSWWIFLVSAQSTKRLLSDLAITVD